MTNTNSWELRNTSWARIKYGFPIFKIFKKSFHNSISNRSYCVLLAAPPKCVMRLENTFCCFPSPQQRTAAQWWRLAARRRQPEAAAAPCMASYIAVHRKTLCSPIFVLFSSHIIIFRWQALQFGFVPSQPSCQSRILYATNTTNQPFAYSPQRPVWEFNSWWFWAIRVWPLMLW